MWSVRYKSSYIVRPDADCFVGGGTREVRPLLVVIDNLGNMETILRRHKSSISSVLEAH
jgi:hypothetical protein